VAQIRQLLLELSHRMDAFEKEKNGKKTRRLVRNAINGLLVTW
jgi:hypothetical protein